MTRISGRTLASGQVRAPIALLTEPLSLWGGLDPGSGVIIDRTHPQVGLNLSGKVLVMASARGSSSSSSTLVEAALRGMAPKAIILQQGDPILLIGVLVVEMLYRQQIPLVLISSADWSSLSKLSDVMVNATGPAAEIIIS